MVSSGLHGFVSRGDVQRLTPDPSALVVLHLPDVTRDDAMFILGGRTQGQPRASATGDSLGRLAPLLGDRQRQLGRELAGHIVERDEATLQ